MAKKKKEPGTLVDIEAVAGEKDLASIKKQAASTGHTLVIKKTGKIGRYNSYIVRVYKPDKPIEKGKASTGKRAQRITPKRPRIS